MGATLAYANRMNLTEMRPHGEITSTGYCLADLGTEYLIYAPLDFPFLESLRFVRRFKQPIRNARRLFRRTITVDLSSHPAQFRIEWMNPSSGEIKAGGSVKGGANVSFTAPFRGDAVLYLKREARG
jgi:hypothetical protein